MALSFDGVDDLIDYGDLAGMDGASALSVLLWYNPNSITGDTDIVVKSSAVTVAIRMEQDADDVIVFHGNGTISCTTPGAALAVGTWVHIASVYDGSGAANADRQKIYINGVAQVLTFAGTVPSTLGDAGATSYELMGNASGQGVGFGNGRCAHHKVWVGTALTPAQAAQEMNSYRWISSRPTIWSPLDDRAAPRDYSGNNNHGTLTGALQVQGPPVMHG